MPMCLGDGLISIYSAPVTHGKCRLQGNRPTNTRTRWMARALLYEYECQSYEARTASQRGMASVAESLPSAAVHYSCRGMVIINEGQRVPLVITRTPAWAAILQIIHRLAIHLDCRYMVFARDTACQRWYGQINNSPVVAVCWHKHGIISTRLCRRDIAYPA